MEALDLEPEIAAALQEWFSAFPADHIRKRVRVLGETIENLRVEYEYLNDQLRRYEEYVDAANAGQQRLPMIESAPQGSNGTQASRTRRESVRALLDAVPAREWKLSEIGDELALLGAMSESKNARHSLQVLVSEMAKKGQIARTDRKGFYKSAAAQPRKC